MAANEAAESQALTLDSAPSGTWCWSAAGLQLIVVPGHVPTLESHAT
jgi:hypothetical protein